MFNNFFNLVLVSVLAIGCSGGKNERSDQSNNLGGNSNNNTSNEILNLGGVGGIGGQGESNDEWDLIDVPGGGSKPEYYEVQWKDAPVDERLIQNDYYCGISIECHTWLFTNKNGETGNVCKMTYEKYTTTSTESGCSKIPGFNAKGCEWEINQQTTYLKTIPDCDKTGTFYEF